MTGHEQPLVFTVSAEQDGERIDKAIVGLLKEAQLPTPRAEVQRWMSDGHVHLDGSPVTKRVKVRTGQHLQVHIQPPPLSEAVPDPSVPFDVIYEDEHLLVVDKPSGVVVHPARGHPTGTLVNGLLCRPAFRADNADPRDPQGHLRPGIVHRIDKDTSGLLVIAKDAATREGLKTLFASHDIERSYLALTIGNTTAGTIESPHGRHPVHRLRFTAKPPVNRPSKRACTDVFIEARFAGTTLVRCTLQTGRTHQVRVHLSEMRRTPILGDRLYGGIPPHGPLRDIALQLGRQALHAAELGFVHPITGKAHRWQSELPSDMQQAKGLVEQLPQPPSNKKSH